MNAIDRAIGYFLPGVALARQRARLSLRRYEGASRGKRTAGWRASAGSANEETRADLPMLRARMRDLIRNNGWASKAVTVWVSNIIEKGIRPRAIAPPRPQPGQRPLRDGDLAAAQDLWREWASSTEADVEGLHNVYGIQRLAKREVVEAGEVLIRRRIRRGRSSVAIPLQLQVLEADHLDETRDRNLAGGGRIVQGVEVTSTGRRVAYWLHPTHPGDTHGPRGGFGQSVRVPASEVLHVYRADRAGQARGVPWGAPAMLVLRDFEDYGQAELVRVKIASTFVGFITDSEVDPDEAADADRGPDDDEDTRAMEPGTLEYLPPGKDITFSKPPEVEALESYARVSLTKAAAGFGVPYEALTGDLRGISFSGGRLGRLDWRAEVEAVQELVTIPRLCAPLWSWAMGTAVGFGELAAVPAAVWTCPPARMIEPNREIQAIKAAVQGGMMSLSEAIRRQGMDPQVVLRELAEDVALARELGLDLDTLTELTQRAPAVDPGSETLPGGGGLRLLG